MNAKKRDLWIDETVSLYLEALEADDFDTQDRVWELAGKDAELEEAIHSLHRGLIEEQRERDAGTIAQAVAAAMPSAEIVKESAGPVTVADVAEEVFHKAGKALTGDGYAWNDKLRASALPLPDVKGESKLLAWLEAEFGPAPAGFAKAFAAAAFDVRLRRAAAAPEYQLAARRAPAPKPEGEG